MAKKTWKESREEDKARRKKKWERGETNLQKAALFIKKKTGWSEKSTGIASKAIGKFGKKVAGKQRTAKDMDQIAAKRKKRGNDAVTKAGFSDKERVAIKQKHEDWKANRAKMQKMRKENPAEYRKIKRAQRKKERQSAMKRSSSTWD